MDSVEELIAAMGNADADVRKQAAIDLSERKEVQATDLLIELLSDRSWEVRDAATLALGYKRGTNVQRALLRAMEDDISQVRETATDSLKKWRTFYQKVKYVYFGVMSREEEKYGTTLKDPDVSELTVPMTNLWWVYINTYSFAQVLLEIFINYAVKYLGKKHLKEHVNICYFGSPKNLNPNLRNLLKNLFAREWRLL